MRGQANSEVILYGRTDPRRANRPNPPLGADIDPGQEITLCILDDILKSNEQVLAVNVKTISNSFSTYMPLLSTTTKVETGILQKLVDREYVETSDSSAGKETMYSLTEKGKTLVQQLDKEKVYDCAQHPERMY